MTDGGKAGRKAVSNSSPIICLYKAGLIELLGKIYSSVILPVAFIDEISAGKDGENILSILKSSTWAQIVETEIIPEVIEWNLGKGEASVISLALKERTLEILIDDQLANRCAKVYQLKTRITLGILVLAKKNGIIKEVKPILEDLIKSGLWVSESLVRKVLKIAGE
jgi:predicted nucleic acid-binding protein